MGRKRKVSIANEEKENHATGSGRRGGERVSTGNSVMLHGPMYTIMSNVQLHETNHKKYIKELKQLYTKMDHDAFMFTFIKMIKTAMAAEEGNEYAKTTLLFCADFVSSYDGEDTHPVLIDISKWLLTTISKNPHIRFRLCQFVNMILNALGREAALDDAICDRILEYMLNRLHDTSPNVRVQAILAMQRLQVPDNPDDPVLRAYQFHLCSDPSSRVRQAVITCMGRNYHTIPYILERLWDIDEKVRRHTYVHMSSYPMRSYKVSQRLTLLQQGLNDRSESVRKVVVNIMLRNWIASYQKDLIGFISALKLDSNETELERFRKVAKQTLKEIFRSQNKEELVACIPLEEDGELHRCVPHEKLTIEMALYWQCLTEYLQAEMAEEFDLVVPELSTFCTYVEKFCESQKSNMDKFEIMDFQYKLLSLVEILYIFDLGDEIGRGNLQKLLAHLLKNFCLNEKIVEVIVRCAENLITDQNARLQYFVEIIQDICDLKQKQNDLLHDRQLINELLASSSDADLNLKLSSLKVKILDLEEQEMNYVQRKDYMKAQQITDEKDAATEEYTSLLRPLFEQHSNAETFKRPLQLRKVVKPETILKSLQITFYMIVSPQVKSLNPSIHNLYNDFICRHFASSQIAIRDWALKCGTACSMLYEALAKDVFDELYAQFFKNHNIWIWETSITCIFELLDRYGLDNFVVQEEQNKTKKSGRQLYNTLEHLDSEDDSNVTALGQGVGVIYMMSHFLDTCDDVCITSAIIIGFCRLILRGYITNTEIIEKLLLRYFNPSTDPKINQILGVFLENLIQRKRHGLLQPCLLPMVSSVLSAPYENPLHDIRPDTITRFIIDSTRQESSSICNGHIHNKLAETFMDEMKNNISNKELCKLLAKEITTLELNLEQNEQLKHELKSKADILIKSDLDPKTIKSVIDFKDMLDGNFNPIRKPAARNDSEGEEESNDEADNDGKDDDETETTSSATDNRTKITQPASIATTKSTVESTVSDEETVATTATDTNANATVTETVQPSIPVVATKEISPSARTPTTYGRENKVDHRYLRKSLNMSRGQSDTEAGDGPPRSPKIRIEARIDSDKKSEQPAEHRKAAGVRNTRTRRNLRYAEKTTNVETTKESVEIETVTPIKVAKGKETTKTPKEQESSTRKANERIAAQKERIKASKVPVRASSRIAGRVVEPVQKVAKAVVATTDDELDTSEVIPASPVVASPQTTMLRRRRHGAGDGVTTPDTSRRATRSLSEQPTKNSEYEAAQRSNDTAVGGAPTPLRNSRKRALQFTPKNAVTAANADTSRASPFQKRLRVNTPPKNAATSPRKARVNATGQQVNEKNETATTSAGSVGISRSSRSRTRTSTPTAQRRRSLSAEKSGSNNSRRSSDAHNNIIVKAKSSQFSQSSQSTEQSQSSNELADKRTRGSISPAAVSERSNRSSITEGSAVRRDSSATSGVTTRNTARRESLSAMRITRQRASLGASSYTSSSGSVPTGVRTARGKSTTKTPTSRIPVKISRLGAQQTKTVRMLSPVAVVPDVTSSSSGTSASSGGDEVTKTKKPLPTGIPVTRRRALTTKMTRINLTQKRSGPIPMRVARPTPIKGAHKH